MPLRLAAAPHWRREVAQVTRTLAEAAEQRHRSMFKVVPLTRILPQLASGRRDTVALLFSDVSATRLHAALRGLARGVPQFRLWWNDAAEAMALTGGRPDALKEELQITFFPETNAALTARGFRSEYVPYLFARPLAAPRPPTEQRIFYAAEVDVSDRCLEGIDLLGHTLRDVSQRCWALAGDVVEGRSSLVLADRALAAQLGDDVTERSAHRAALWALRNRVRYLLVKAVSLAFGTRLDLYHQGWVDLGFHADASRLSAKACSEKYSRFRVSLDAGGKSSHSSIYPRVAHILSASGGLAQFLPEGVPCSNTPVLPERQATTAQELLTLIERLLQGPSEAVLAENMEMFDRYRAARLDTGDRLIRVITEHSQAHN